MQRETDELDDDDRALLERVRALELEGDRKQPDWAALELAIRDAVSHVDPYPWWRRWRWALPVGVLAVAAAAAMVFLRAPETRGTREASSQATPTPTPYVTPAHAVPAVATPAAEAPAALWLDGAAVELDEVDDTMFDDLDRDARNALGSDGETIIEGILPTHDLHWIDDLDEASIQRVEHWLEGKKT